MTLNRKNDYLNAVNSVKVGNPLGKSVLRLLADLSRANGGFCWPSEAYIAEALEMAPATVRKWLSALVDAKIIVRRRLTADEGKKFGIHEWWKRSGFEMNFNPNQASLFGRQKRALSPLPRSTDKPEYSGVSPLPDSSESPPQDSANKNCQRHEVAESALPRITDTSWRNNSIKNRSFKPVVEPVVEELIDQLTHEHPERDRRLIEIAVIHTLIRRNGSKEKINSLAYFAPEIEKICELAAKGRPSESVPPMTSRGIDTMLGVRRQQYENHIRKKDVAVTDST